MRAFKMQRVQFLVAPNVAAGGMDFEELSFLIHHLIHHQLSEVE
jgi:hypothetical protein